MKGFLQISTDVHFPLHDTPIALLVRKNALPITSNINRNPLLESFTRFSHLESPFSFPLGTVSPNSKYSSCWNLWVYGRKFSHLSFRYSCQHYHFWSLCFSISWIYSKSYRLPFLAIQNVLLPPSSFLSIFRWITASVSYLVSCIFGAESLILYVVTRFLTDGCFQAHCQVVFGIRLPFALSMKFETLSINLGCLPLNVQYLSTAVGLRSSFFQCNSIHSLHRIGTLWHALTGTELYLIALLRTGTA